jgi:predicted nucleotidyltransferase
MGGSGRRRFGSFASGNVMTTKERTKATVADPPQNDKVLTRFRVAVAEIYGDRLERVVLFGSRARGDASVDSGYDIAIFIKDPGTFTDDSDRRAAITTDSLVDTGAVIPPHPFLPEPAGFMHELRKDGLDL